MMGNCHVRFLGEGDGATQTPLPDKHKTEGRNLLVYEKGAIWKRELDQGVLAVSELGALVQTAQSRETVCEVRIVPKGGHYVIEVVYQHEATPAPVDPALFVAADLQSGDCRYHSPGHRRVLYLKGQFPSRRLAV